MSLKYALLEAHLTSIPNDYIARVQTAKSHDIDSILEKMVQKGSTLTKADALAALHLFSEVLADITKNGEIINTDIFKTNVSIQGTFNNADDSFDPKRHSVHVNMRAGAVFKNATKRMSLEKISTSEIHPHVLEVKDVTTASVNRTITSEGAVEIIGSTLKIAGDDTKNGVYFVDKDNTAHKATTVVDNKPTRLIVMVPPLPQGDYTLHITTQYNGTGRFLQTPRTSTFHKHLTIAST